MDWQNNTPAPRQTLHAQAYEQIKEALMKGVYRPGQKVTIRALAAAFGTSIMPVREALRRLAAEGALDILPNRTVRVPVLTKERLLEITSIRTRLEGLAAARAAMRMGEGEIQELERLQIEMAAASDRRDFQALLDSVAISCNFAMFSSALGSRSIVLFLILYCLVRVSVFPSSSVMSASIYLHNLIALSLRIYLSNAGNHCLNMIGKFLLVVFQLSNGFT